MSEAEQKPEQVQESETITTTIEVNKELFLKFKSFCVLNETTLSSEIEKLIKKRVEQLIKDEANIAEKPEKK